MTTRIYLKVLMLTLLVCFVTETQTSVQIIAVCDEDFSVICQRSIKSRFPRNVGPANDSVEVSVRLISPGKEDTYVDLLKELQDIALSSSPKLLLGFGTSDVVNAAATVAQNLDLPVIVYSTSKSRRAIYTDNTISLGPDHGGLGQAAATLVGSSMIDKAYVISQDTRLSDGFLETFFQKSYILGFNGSHQAVISMSESDHELRLKLLTIHDSGFRLVVLHCFPQMLKRVVAMAGELHYFEQGFAWIITESAVSSFSVPETFQLPYGLLAIEGYEKNKYEDIINQTLEAILETVEQIPAYWRVEVEDTAFTDNSSNTMASAFDFISAFTKSTSLFHTNGARVGLQFRLLNYVKSEERDSREWKTVGFIQDNKFDLDTVVWPGQTIFGPVGIVREHYTIVTRPAEPFMFVRGPVSTAYECAADMACLKVHSYEARDIKSAVENFKGGEEISNSFYSIYCCEGIVVDVLHSLSVEVGFDFLLYFHNDSNYGHQRQGEWTGMMGDVVSGAADIAAGAISITAERLSAVTFTEPIYYSSFNMLSLRDEKYTSFLAFLYPFAPIVWVMIFVSATVVAISTSLLEWNSPFGLNPWGKRRSRNYTLGSGLTMVYSILFGHIVNTKSPKSWPSKVLQNVWAGMAIFIIASYTANLAAYLAGNTYADSTYSILDSKLNQKKVGVIPTSAVKEFVQSINQDLHLRLQKFYVKDAEEGMKKLRRGDIDLYMDDSPILDYALSHFDSNCSMKYAAHSFGDNAYAFGLKKGSWLKAKLDPLILNYVELGFVENLKWRYYGHDRQCENQLMNSADLQFGLQHTGGLFVMLAVAVGVAFLLMFLEHIAYFYIVPKLRESTPDSIWKKRNMEYVSQRLYRVINSEKVKPPAEELAMMVKKKQLHKVFKVHGHLRRNTQSLPAELSAFNHKQNNSYISRVNRTSTIYDKVPHSKSQGELVRSINNVFTISNGGFDLPPCFGDTLEVIDELEEDNCRHLHSVSFRRSSYESFGCGVDNPVFEDDTGTSQHILSVEFHPQPQTSGMTQRQSGSSQSRTNDLKQSYRKSSKTSIMCNGQCAQEETKRCKRYETWPAPGKFKKSLKKPKNFYQQRSFSFADQDVLVVEPDMQPTYGKSKGVSFELKDNRAKSTIRRHAMASCSDLRIGQDSAVESLSKEDLLILWKRSEIDLQTRLNKTISQNHHLRHLLQLVDRSDTVDSVENSDCLKKSNILVSTRL